MNLNEEQSVEQQFERSSIETRQLTSDEMAQLPDMATALETAKLTVSSEQPRIIFYAHGDRERAYAFEYSIADGEPKLTQIPVIHMLTSQRSGAVKKDIFDSLKSITTEGFRTGNFYTPNTRVYFTNEDQAARIYSEAGSSTKTEINGDKIGLKIWAVNKTQQDDGSLETDRQVGIQTITDPNEMRPDIRVNFANKKQISVIVFFPPGLDENEKVKRMDFYRANINKEIPIEFDEQRLTVDKSRQNNT